MSLILQQLYRCAAAVAARGRSHPDQDLLMRAADEIRALRTALSRQRGDTIALMVDHERGKL